MSILEKLFTGYGTDKGIWGYTPAYEEHLRQHRHRVSAVLEIGICGFRDIPNNVVGASLFAWRDYFPNAQIYGIDNDSRFVFNDQHHITTACADAYDHQQLMSVMQGFNDVAFDFICDDAVHDPAPQLKLLSALWPFLKVGGKYAIEECCPYKCPDNEYAHTLAPFLTRHPEALVTEYRTHKDERLSIITKHPYD